ncbi:homeobox protein 2-like [Condylostylus longicornis]|uniref:homeobox protein 2-like n=1 Tax=Condylostylus longicornis TaxID=2530218 RepID=UPI00244E4408|nr:homeobox protein 2-like [Condylostylus longicornis]
MSWNQWATTSSMPTVSATGHSTAMQPPNPLGPVPTYSATAAPPTIPAVPPANPSFNYAAMTPEQQYAIQQNWQQWQAYQQQYAQWHAQYGEQYQREMQAKLGSTAPQLPYSGGVSQTQAPPPAAPPQPLPSAIAGFSQNYPPPQNSTASFLSVPPPPPDQDSQKFVQNISRPPPPPQDNAIATQSLQSIQPKLNESGNLHGNQNNNKVNQYFEKDNFNKSSANINNYGNNNQSNKSNQSYDRRNEKISQKEAHDNFNVSSQMSYGRNYENKNSNRMFDNKYSDERIQTDNTNNNEKSREEILFDEQFKKWEEEFENWKRANVNHPDRKAYREYEMKFEDCRRKLIERREQMRKRKLEQMQRNMPQTQSIPNQQDENLTKHQNETETSIPQKATIPLNEPKLEEEKKEDLSEKVCDQDERGGSFEKNDESEEKSDSQHFLTSTNSAEGIPGLDLVHEDVKKNDGEEVAEVIDLDKQVGEGSPVKKQNRESNDTIINSSKNDNIWMQQSKQTILNTSQPKKIPSLFDTKIEKPEFSPPRKTFEDDVSNQSGLGGIENTVNKTAENTGQKTLDLSSCPLPENITKALQDPGVLAILSSALKGNQFDSNDAKSTNNAFNNDRGNTCNSDFNSPLRKFDNERNFQPNIWDDQDRRTDWMNRSDSNYPRFGNEYANNMNQRNRFDDRFDDRYDDRFNDGPMSWKNYERNDNRGSNFSNFNERNRGGGFGGQRYDDNENNDNFRRDNENNRGFNPFKRDNDQNQNRDQSKDNMQDSNDDMDRSQGQNNRGRERDRDRGRGDRNRGRDNRNDRSNSNKRNNRNRSNRSRSNNRNNRFDDKKGENPFDTNDRTSTPAFNPFRRGENANNNSIFGSNKNQSEPDDYFKPTQVIDYQNKSLKSNDKPEDIFPLAKVVDYGHKKTGNNQKETSKPNEDYFPMKTIDYGHASTMFKGDSQPEEKKPEKIEKPAAPSFGGGFGDFLASKTMGGAAGIGKEKKVEDYKPPVNKDSGFNLNKPESSQMFGHILSTNSQGNINLNFCQRTLTNKKNLDDNNAQYQFKNTDFKNKFNNFNNNNKLIDKNSNIDVDEISSDDDDENYSNESKNVATGTNNVGIKELNNIKNTTSFSTYLDTITTLKESNKSNNENNILNMIPPPPPPLISTNVLEIFSPSVNKPVYSYNHNIKNDSFQNLINSYSNISCPTLSSSISTSENNQNINNNNNVKQLIFPSMENHNTITIDEILLKPSRDSRPKKIVIILRGPPGSGKSYLAKLIKEKEIEMKGSQPRILSIDDYFMNEVDKEERCPKTKRKIIKQELVYEFDKEMEAKYIEFLLKSYKKTLSEGLFNFVIVDCHNHSLRTFTEFYNIAKAEGFTPYTIDLICDIEKCLKNNIHDRDRDEIKDMIDTWKETPEHYIKLDVKSLIEEVVDIQEVEMEDAFDNITEPESDENSHQSAINNNKSDNENEDELSYEDNFKDVMKSKWDADTTEDRLARLDGIKKKLNKHDTLEDYLQMDGWEPPISNSQNKKRVRWADIEEKRAQDKMRAIGFVVGHTDWNRMMDPTGGSSALTKTKYIERINKSALSKK